MRSSHLVTNLLLQMVNSTDSIFVIEASTASSSISYQTKVRFNVWGTNKYLTISGQGEGQVRGCAVREREKERHPTDVPHFVNLLMSKAAR